MACFWDIGGIWRIKKYNSKEIKIHDNSGDIEARYEAKDMLSKIKKDNIKNWAEIS